MELQMKKLLLVFVTIYTSAYAITNAESTISPRDIKNVETTLLSALGMKKRPVIDKNKVHIPEAMINLYKLESEYESTALPLPGKLTRSANIVRSYTHEESEIDTRFPQNYKFRLFFNLSNFPTTEELISSELKLTIIVSNASNCSDTKSNRDNNTTNVNTKVTACTNPHVQVHDIVQPGIKGLSKPILRRVELARVNTTSTEMNLDVLPIVERWLSNHSHNQNYGLLVEVRSLNGAKCSSHIRLRPPMQSASTVVTSAADVNDEVDVHADNTRWRLEQPLLMLYSEDEQHRQNRLLQPKTDLLALERRKRSARPRNRQSGECRRHSLQARFKDLGWDSWIVSPTQYEMFYCDGECPVQMDDNLNVTNHAIVQGLMNSAFPSVIPRPCCVPTTMSSISLLYLNEHDKVVLQNYDNMVVESCGCR